MVPAPAVAPVYSPQAEEIKPEPPPKSKAGDGGRLRPLFFSLQEVPIFLAEGGMKG